MSPHPREPFDADEAAAARLLRALPAPEPAPALDARILAQARAAVAPRGARARRPWFLGAGLGAAAAAVMAAGIAWQVGLLGPTSKGPADTPTASRTAEPAHDPAADERVEIEFYKQERRQAEPVPQAAAPPAAAAAAQAQRSRDSTEAPPASPPPPPPVASAPAGKQHAEAMPEAIAAPEPFPSEAPAPAAASPAPAPAQDAAAGAGLSRAQPAPATNEGLVADAPRRAASRALPPWTTDAQLAADAWLERIRERVQGGDRQSAQLSLRRFVLEHPRHEVPRDLRRLLVE